MPGISLAVVVPVHDAKGGALSLDRALAAGVELEEAGCDALVVAQPLKGHRPDPFVVLGAIAARTRRILLGAFVDPLRERQPSLLAKATSGLDVVAAGRAFLLADARGALGRRAGGDGEAMARFSESLAVMEALFGPGPADYEGPTYRLAQAWNEPKMPDRRLSLGLVADAVTPLSDLVEKNVAVALVVRPDGARFAGEPRTLALVSAPDAQGLAEVVARRRRGEFASADGLLIDLGSAAFGAPSALRDAFAALRGD